MPSKSSADYPTPGDAVKVPVTVSKIKAVPTFCSGDKCDVTEVHNYLKHYGYMPLSASASSTVVGEETTTALKAFQEFFGLKVDGIFGPDTRKAMTEERCGFPDVTQSVDFTVLGPWKDRNIKYCFGKQSSQLDANVCKAAIRRAIKTWTDAGVGLTATEVAATDNPEVFIEFRPANDPDHSMVGGVLAHADFPPGYSVIVNGLPLPVHYDDQEHKWVDGAVADSFDIETVGLHEFGHILGLAHSSVAGSIMYPSVSPNLLKRVLTEDDRNAIRNLYPTWRNLGGLYYGLPAVTSWAPGRTDVFVRGTNNAVYHKWQNGGGTAWGPSETGYENLGGTIYGNVTAVSWGNNRIDLFALGTDNACWHKWWDGAAWRGWESLGGAIIGDICAVSWVANRLDLFVRGMNNGVFHKAWNGSAWLPSVSGWTNLGGVILGSPKAVCWGPNRIDVLVRGTNNGVYQKTWNGTTWQPSVLGWQSLGGTVMDDITPVSTAPNRLDLFVQGTNNSVYQKSWNGSAWVPSATGWTSLGGVVMSRPSAVAWGGNKISLAVQGTDNAVYTKEWNGSTWVDWHSIGGVITDSPVVDPRGGDRMAIYVRGTNASMYTYD
ncbi:Carbohydrate-binding protein [Tolypocladium paradoxum]|uniref:Carbohydrate-binding protein n=1 Tax=Tolypocladium paradoxum TaxID=94208 RepID=A0A2S4L3R2_9HYPO|nr:Carbohydrate-binding protein [Tolypocladium paradoxum]